MFTHMKNRFGIELVKINPADMWKFNMCTDLSFTISILDLNKTYEPNLNVYLYIRVSLYNV